MQWHKTHDKQHVYANEKGKILSKVYLVKDYWVFRNDEYLTLEQAKAAVEADPRLDKENELPWNT